MTARGRVLCLAAAAFAAQLFCSEAADLQDGGPGSDAAQRCAEGAASEACIDQSGEAEDVGLLQHQRKVPATLGVKQATDNVTLGASSPVVLSVHGGSACTGGNQDPYAGSSHVDCCAGLNDCLGDWHHTGTWSYLCLASCGKAPPPPTNTGLSICSSATSMGDSSVWSVAANSGSCRSSKGILGTPGFACQDEAGNTDASSIFVDMTTIKDKVGCFVWETDDCQYSMKSVKHIDFDVEWDGCNNLWMAPLWTFSWPWAPETGRQGLSGEVDFVEQCPVPSMDTNLGCFNAEQGDGCVDGQHWGEGTSSNGPRHMTMTLDSSGNLEVQACSIDKTGCSTVASYRNYINTVYPTTKGRDNAYKFMSDVFNDAGKDGGWGGCKAVRNPSTTCKYAVRNIEITSNNGIPVFTDPSSKCYALNAKAGGYYSVPHMFGESFKLTPTPATQPQQQQEEQKTLTQK